MSITIDAALGGPFDKIGEVIKKNNVEDSSGLRRMVVFLLGQREFDRAADALGCSVEEATQLREICVKAWGEPPRRA